ncbi:contractile injection system protein, VgrG/Pvc8 family [Solirubrobacter ginsenosidimutans]|uniref:Contractile injection system protein, VgrG/Pvc8 family n=1 Tax=Solirubrobacter ginsenosidimutans TaxID=490573 RepID=A0A9X3N2W8_9ACTN|nr:contractile injection system protein, VgrG/Pvc8 family [Solirubrobacter ginsenosidimutans]MDA0166271.1 contractile injection system protein, VgrG/Pvc8 family [Solirubrobacter ginsenosidimutans]
MAGTPALYAARPSVLLDGADNAELSGGLISARVEDSAEGCARCEASFGNWGEPNGTAGYRYLDRSLLDFGKTLALRMGAGDGAAEVFRGRITGLEARFPEGAAPELVVLAEDRLQDLRMTRRTRTFEKVTDRDVIQRVAQGYGLQTQLDVDGPQRAVVAQVNQSDLAFLRDVARRVDAELWMEGDTLHARQRSRRKGSPVKITYGRELREIAILADVAGQHTGVSVSGWDVAAKQAIDVEATDAAIQPELAGGTSGPATLRRAFGARPGQVVHFVPTTTSEARAAAENRLRETARRFLTARGVTEGDGRIRVGAAIDVVGVGALNGTYHVARALHTFDGSRGYLTTFELERAGL